MIRRLHFLVVLAVLAGIVALGAIMSRPRRTEGLVLKGKEIRIYGPDYTLARLAREIADPQIFAYDAQKREGTSKASLVVYGSLQIGDPADPRPFDPAHGRREPVERRLGETLLLDTVVCGDLRIEVARGGELRVYNSIVQTVSQVLTADACSRGYAFVVEGRLRAADSRFLYMSGLRSVNAGESAEVDLERVAFAWSDDWSFRAQRANGADLHIRDSQFTSEGQFGVLVDGWGGAPVVLRRCELLGKTADLALTGRRPSVELVDCRFTKTKVLFLQRGGRLAVRWTVTVKVVDQRSGQPLPGVEVAATSTGKGPSETVTARTGPDGTCPLLLTEYVATSEFPARIGDTNNVTPHRIVATSASGAALASLAAYDARGLQGVVTLAAPASVSR